MTKMATMLKNAQNPKNSSPQGHLVTLAKVTLVEKIMVKLGESTFSKSNKAKWKCVSYEGLSRIT